MCRFICYKGREILLSELLYQPRNSLIVQSYKSKEREEPLNGDGFGVGWYEVEISATPCVFTSITPAWSNRNLRHLAEHVASTCFFAHVRAASSGMHVSELNCHPFQYQRYLWMHNGGVAEFKRIKRRLRGFLSDRVYEMVQGTTDSEHAFGLFLDLLEDPDGSVSCKRMGRALVETIFQLEQWSSDAGITTPSYYNFCVTNGDSVAAVRYVSDPRLEPISLYYATDRKYECRNGVCHLIEAPASEHAVIITSEPLTELDVDWRRVPPNHLVTVTGDLQCSVEPVEKVGSGA
ncbi:MAG: class II glutamine amidotransferase [Acidobacteriota bacterium]